MKRAGAIGTVAVIAALAAPAGASAGTWTVDPAAPNGCSAGTCRTIGQAATAASPNDTILVRPGTYSESPTFGKSGLTVSGTGTGQAIVLGTMSFTAANGRLNRVVVRASGNSPALRFDGVALDPAKTLTVDSSILSGAGSGAGISARTDLGAGAVTINARHVTIADAGAPATSLNPAAGASVTLNVENSIVLGAQQGTGTVNASNLDTDGSPAHQSALFVNPAAEDFRLKLGSPAINQGGTLAGGENAVDVDGETRPSTGTDRGADEYVNDAPTTPALSAFPNPARPGQGVGFVASGVTDRDVGLGDSVRYRWSFGDGQSAETATAFAVHPYASAGRYPVTVTARDTSGASSPVSNIVMVDVQAQSPGTGPPEAGGAVANDVRAPFIAITSPRRGQRVRAGRRGPVLRGRTADDSGVRRVELALVRLEGRRCRWYDGRRSFRLGPCSRPRFFRATVDDFTWRYALPRSVRPRPGRYVLRARATDVRGNRTTGFTAAARTLVSFRIIR